MTFQFANMCLIYWHWITNISFLLHTKISRFKEIWTKSDITALNKMLYVVHKTVSLWYPCIICVYLHQLGIRIWYQVRYSEMTSDDVIVLSFISDQNQIHQQSILYFGMYNDLLIWEVPLLMYYHDYKASSLQWAQPLQSVRTQFLDPYDICVDD